MSDSAGLYYSQMKYIRYILEKGAIHGGDRLYALPLQVPPDAAAMRSVGESHSILIGSHDALAVLSKCEQIAA